MDLEEVDVVRAQSFEALLHTLLDVLPVDLWFRAPVPEPVDPVTAASHLCGHDNLEAAEGASVWSDFCQMCVQRPKHAAVKVRRL